MCLTDISVNLERIQLLVELKTCFFLLWKELSDSFPEFTDANKMHILVVFYKIICQIQLRSVRNQSVYNDIL